MLPAVIGLVLLLSSALQLSAEPTYYWKSLPVAEPATAQLVTLFCHACSANSDAKLPGSREAQADVPLVSVLRDTLGSDDPANRKITAVWLLSYAPPDFEQRALAAIPFFYWNVNSGSSRVKNSDTKPLLDLSAPQHPAAAGVERQILQWSALDTVGASVRASSREYRTNEVDHERLHLEEANVYLLNAPVGNGPDELTEDERDFVMARLELRKKLLGGFVTGTKVESLGQAAGFEEERVRARNWELLRQCAEKTGLVFEPVTLASSEQQQYGMLWFPQRAILEPTSANLAAIWKLLGIRNPYTDPRVTAWTGYTKTTVLLNPAQSVNLIPLGFYSFSYPRQPLLMVDFRDQRNLRRNDITQKSINEITSGVVGLSHFTNWYYFVASDVFNFIQERRGKTNNRAARLDSYSEFRVSLALDHSLDPALKSELVKRSDGLSSNPLEEAPSRELAAAAQRYSLLTVEAAGDRSRLVKRIDNQRREELANLSEGSQRQGVDITLHALTLGSYTHRVKRDGDNFHQLSLYRRAEYNVEFLDKLVAAGTPPEVTHQSQTVQASVVDLGNLLPEIESRQMRRHIQSTLASLGKISSDRSLRAACDQAYQKSLIGKPLTPSTVHGISAVPPIAPIGRP